MKHMKHIKQITAAGLSAVLFGTTAMPVHAESASDEKQEVIYAMADASGKVDDIEVVNIFNGGEITDYGDYSAVKVLNTTDKIQQNGDQVRISSAADKVYYQGTITGKSIPWNISIRYFLDGKEYSASEIAGKSGALNIRFSISENAKCEGSFYDDYALQASFTLGSEKCSHIVANGATLANVGSNKQISYTMLPGKGIDTIIRADVTDFEMDAVAINGIKLDLNVEIDDAELKNKVSDLIDAVKQLDDGASKLHDGTEELLGGSSDLKTGASSLHSGNAALDEGILTLQDGLNTVQNGLNSLNAQSSTLTTGSSEFKSALEQIQKAVNSISAAENGLTNLGYEQYKALMKQNGLDIDALTTGNAEAVEKIEELETLLGQISRIPGYADIIDKYKLDQTAGQIKGLLNANNAALGGMELYLNGISKKLPALTNGINLLMDNYEKLDSGIGAYTDGVSQIVSGYSQVMNGVSSLANGSKELVSGSDELYDGTSKLYDGVASLCDGAKDMAEGTGQFRSETSGMKEKTEEEIDNILDTIGGSMENPVSFISSKNTNVDSVQFVMKVEAIEKAEEEVRETTEPEHLNFGQKLLKLFGF